MLGVCIGTAFHAVDGMCRVFQSLDSTRYVVLVSKSGNRRVMRRELVQWRPTITPTQQPGRIPPAESAPVQPTLFDLE